MKQKRSKHKSALSIWPAGPAPDLNYFRNKVSHLLELVSTFMYFSGPMLGYSSYILGVSIKLLLQIDCSLSYSENYFFLNIHNKTSCFKTKATGIVKGCVIYVCQQSLFPCWPRRIFIKIQEARNLFRIFGLIRAHTQTM